MLHLIVAQKEESADEDEASGDETGPAAPPQDLPAVEIPGANPAGTDDQPAAVVHPVGEPAVGDAVDNPPATENIADEPPVFVDGAGTVRRAARSRTTSERQRTLSVVSVHASCSQPWVTLMAKTIDSWTKCWPIKNGSSGRMKKAAEQLEAIKTRSADKPLTEDMHIEALSALRVLSRSAPELESTYDRQIVLLEQAGNAEMFLNWKSSVTNLWKFLIAWKHCMLS